jgi:glutaminyl-peptide cyclotransferase
VIRELLVLALVLVQAAAPAPRFDGNAAFEHLRRVVAIGPRPAGSPQIAQTRRYLREQLATLGITVTEQAWDDRTPAGPVHMVNLMATIPGASRDRLIIAGHYDTKRFTEFRFVGANDGGSSAAFLLEMARVLKGRQNPFTIELLFLDGEEAVVEWEGTDRVYGSRHYVEAARRGGSLTSIKALVLVDMIADRDLELKRDLNSSPWLTQIIWSAARERGLGRFFVNDATAIEDDHLPFLEAGVPAVDLIDLDYPAWHTADDTLEAVSARSLQVVGDVLLAALPRIEQQLGRR